jgi:hypothetical protein
MTKNGIEVDLAMLHSCVDAYKTKLKNLKNNVKTRRISKKHNSLSKLFTILQNKYQNLLAYDLDEHLSQFSNNLTISHKNLLAKKDQSIVGANLLVENFSKSGLTGAQHDDFGFGEIFASGIGDDDCSDEDGLFSSKCGLTSFNPLSKNITDRNSESMNIMENLSVDSAKLIQTIDEFFIESRGFKSIDGVLGAGASGCKLKKSESAYKVGRPNEMCLRDASDVTERVNSLKKDFEKDDFFTSNFIDSIFNN